MGTADGLSFTDDARTRTQHAMLFKRRRRLSPYQSNKTQDMRSDLATACTLNMRCCTMLDPLELQMATDAKASV